MISISQNVKLELSQTEPTDGAGALAELSAIVACAGTLGLSGAGRYVEAAGGGPALKARVDRLLSELYGTTSGEAEGSGLKNQSGSFRVSGAAAERLLEDCQIIVRGEGGLLEIARSPDRYLVEDEAAARAYLAGAFIAAGSLSVPPETATDGATGAEYQAGGLGGGAAAKPDLASGRNKGPADRPSGRHIAKPSGYHMELALSSAELADGIAALMAKSGILPKKVLRKGKVVLYLKDSGAICDFLALIGAARAALYLNGLVAGKSLNNTVNRRVNCEEANIGRAVEAAARQTAAVKALKAAKRLDSLPEPLRELAKARLANPGLGMAEIGALLRPPLSKSGVNHRFERIVKIADEIKYKI